MTTDPCYEPLPCNFTVRLRNSLEPLRYLHNRRGSLLSRVLCMLPVRLFIPGIAPLCGSFNLPFIRTRVL